MNSKTNYILVGLFVLGMGTTLIAGVLWLSSGGPGRAYQVYAVYMTESVSGLSVDGAVKYRGVDVGRIRDIALDPDNLEQVRLLLEIEEGTPIREDTVATLAVQGLTGLGHINLEGGSQTSPPLAAQPGKPYPVIASRPSVWGRMDHSLGVLLDNLTKGTERLNTLFSDENQRLLTDMLKHLNTISGMLADRSDALGQSIDDLSGTLRNARAASGHLPELVDQLQQAARSLEKMADEIGATGKAIRQTVDARDRDLQRFTGSTLPEAASMVQELREAAGNFRRLSESLERDPSVLLYGPPQQAMGPGE